jgi:hypothetical protein
MNSRDIIKRRVSEHWWYEDCKQDKAHSRSSKKAARQSGKSEIRQELDAMAMEPELRKQERWNDEMEQAWLCYLNNGPCKCDKI